MRIVVGRLILVIAVSLGISGCQDSPQGPAEQPDSGSDWLNRYRACPSDAAWRGQSLCESPANSPALQGSPPETAICTHGIGNQNHHVRLFFDVSVQSHWAFFETTHEERLSGLLRLTSGTETALYLWEDHNGSVAFAIDDLPDNFVLQVFVYQDGVQSSDPRLNNSALVQLWNWLDGDYHAVHQAYTPEGPVFLYKRSLHPVTAEWQSDLPFRLQQGAHFVDVSMGTALSTGEFSSVDLTGRCL